MKLISWNVNGLRACMGKGFMDFFFKENADIFCIQETKMQEGQLDLHIEGYYHYLNSAIKKGYSGTLVYTKVKPLTVHYGLPDDQYTDEGRIITLEYETFYLVNVYVPNSQRELTRLAYRMQFEQDFRQYLSTLQMKKPVVLCGDLNVAHEEIDLKNPKQNTKSAGFTLEERMKFKELLASGFSDTFRSLYPEKIQYSWWSYMFNSRAKNVGWRIDYFVVSNEILKQVKDAKIHTDVYGSDHCPVELELNLL